MLSRGIRPLLELEFDLIQTFNQTLRYFRAVFLNHVFAL